METFCRKLVAVFLIYLTVSGHALRDNGRQSGDFESSGSEVSERGVQPGVEPKELHAADLQGASMERFWQKLHDFRLKPSMKLGKSGFSLVRSFFDMSAADRSSVASRIQSAIHIEEEETSADPVGLQAVEDISVGLTTWLDNQKTKKDNPKQQKAYAGCSFDVHRLADFDVTFSLESLTELVRATYVDPNKPGEDCKIVEQVRLFLQRHGTLARALFSFAESPESLLQSSSQELMEADTEIVVEVLVGAVVFILTFMLYYSHGKMMAKQQQEHAAINKLKKKQNMTFKEAKEWLRLRKKEERQQRQMAKTTVY